MHLANVTAILAVALASVEHDQSLPVRDPGVASRLPKSRVIDEPMPGSSERQQEARSRADKYIRAFEKAAMPPSPNKEFMYVSAFQLRAGKGGA